jgi:DinB superfamily
MKLIAVQLQDLIRTTFDRLSMMPDELAKKPLSPGKWSRKEVVGHLVDSAANNHQRFVRAALKDELRYPGYQQTGWVALQNYREEAWGDLLALWKAFNLHIAHVIESIPEERFDQLLVVGENEPVTLRFLIEDYVDHLRKHVGQLQL